MADLPLANPPIGPLGLIGDAPVPSIETRTEEQYFSDINTPTGTKPIRPDLSTPAPADPWAAFQDAGFDQFQDAPDEFANFQTADDLDVKSVEELDADRDNFRPSDYFTNNPDVAKDPKKLAKLIEVYRRRDAEGLTAKGVAKAAIKDTPGIVADIGGGIKRFGERVIDVVVQPTANVVLGTLTGDLFDDQKRAALFNETRKTIKKGMAEGAAGAESATVGLVDLARTADQKISSGAITSFDDLPRTRVSRPEAIPAKPKTDQQLLAQLADDAAFRQNAADILTGQGEAAKNFGLDKETLAKQGIELDENAVRQLSLVDPVTMVATGGAFKLVGVGGKILATAKTLEGAKALTDGLVSVAKASKGLAKFSASKTAKGVGRVATDIGKAAEGKTFGSLGLASPLITGDLTGIAQAAAVKYGLGPIARKTGEAATQLGKEIAGDVPRSAGFQKFVDYTGKAAEVGNVVAKGAVEGIVAGSPFALAAQDDETAGALLGAGAALGAAGAAGAGAFRVVKNSASRRYFAENRPVLPDVSSAAYGFDAMLDAQHEANIQKLSAQDASELNNFREALRQQGGEIYAVDKPTFRQKVAQEYRARTGQQIDPALLTTYENHSAFFDETNGDRKVVYLNSDTSGLSHDAGHIFDAVLSPEKRAELRSAVEDAFTPEQRQAFRDTYERRVGSKISDKAAVDEFIAEQFSALFNNVPVTELNAPKSLLNKFIDVAAEGAEALGIDLSAGATTPNLGAPVSVGIRQLFRNAAGEVTRANIEGVPPSPIKVDFGGNPPPDGGVPSPTPAPPPTGGGPATVIPLPRPPSRPIRPSGTDLPPQVTPEARAAAAARFAETGIENARLNAASDPVIARAVEEVSTHMEGGNPVLEIDHLGIVSEGTPDSPEGRTSRRATQAAGYEALKGELSRAGAPDDLVASHLKTFVPVRWTQQGGTPTLSAMSLDKALQNIIRVGSDPKAADLIPYPTENGKLTAQGWRDAVSDLKSYAENQANGRKGDGGRLTVPEAGELSIPVENPAYTPHLLSPERADFQNLIMGLDVPDTARRAPKGKTPRNVKGQLLAEANLRPTETPANISGARRAGNQAFVDFPPRTIQEVNPLRNRLKEAGAPSVGQLIEVTERIRAVDIERVTPRPDINFKAPVTDIIQGGFLPATEFRQRNLNGRTVEEFSDYLFKSSPEEWKAATDAFTGGLTGGAWSLGLGLKNAADVSVLKSFQEKLSTATKEAMQSGDFDLAYSLVSKGQFFREAHEAATGTGSAGAAFKRGTMGTEGVKVPFPVVEKTQATAAATPDSTTITIGESGAQFLPRTESGKALEKQGYKIKPFGELGVRGVEIFDRDNNRAGEIISESVTENEVGIQNVLVRPQFRGKGIGEVLYRELGAQLKEDGVTRVIGDVVAPEPLALRRKVFGEFENIQVNGEPSSLGDALTAANMTRKGVQLSHVEAANRITSESPFLPAEELAVGLTEGTPEPELRVLPAAPGGRPPTEPPGFRPLPVAARGAAPTDEDQGGFQPKKEEATPEKLPTDEELDKRFPVAKELVDGRTVREEIPNRSSVGASFGDYEYLKGIRDVPMDEFPGLSGKHYSVQGSKRIDRLAAEIEASKELNPLIVAVDKDGPYILEGATRAEALKKLGATSFPALVVKDLDAGFLPAKTEAGRQLEEKGFQVVQGDSKVTIKNIEGADIAEIKSLAPRSKVTLENPKAENAQELREALRQELAEQLKERERTPNKVEPTRLKEKTPRPQAAPKEKGAVEKERPSRALTGWILPNRTFAALEGDTHERFLAQNSVDLNKRFGTKFSDTTDFSEKLNALNKGFVRFRFDSKTGDLRVEANADAWPKVKPAVKRRLHDYEESITSFTISILNARAIQVDSVTVTQMHELSGPQRIEAIDEAVDSLRVPTQ